MLRWKYHKRDWPNKDEPQETHANETQTTPHESDEGSSSTLVKRGCYVCQRALGILSMKESYTLRNLVKYLE